MRIFNIKKPKAIPVPNQQYDERDTMFARMARKPNTEVYDHYYSNNPSLKKKDDHIRSLPPLLDSKGKYYDSDYSEKARQLFNSIEDISIDNRIVDKHVKLFRNNISKTNVLKKIAIELGAVSVGCTNLEGKFVYSHKGRFDNNYGKKIILEHQNVFVFLVEMDFEQMSFSPKANVIVESAKQYYRAAVISKTLEAIILKLGYEAKAHYDAYYDVILPPIAVQAGLGELGRNNILIADKFGSRVRIGAVTTDLYFEYDSPISIGANRFCDVCKKCATNCPTKALSINGKSTVRGIEKWTTNVEKCYSIWRFYGTDCGICMAVCPFSHRNNWFHYLIRKVVKFFPIFNKILLFFEDLIYRKKWRIKK
ncbi:MAG: 4Fe-4S dicluster domain-containing protein [Candidatus Marinimicrobia bacterium]|nr:4Fe-4S dicluster domain-containing protein [Candidatus Neomarinimicrobiota bacterium]